MLLRPAGRYRCWRWRATRDNDAAGGESRWRHGIARRGVQVIYVALWLLRAGVAGLELIAQARADTGLAVVTAVMTPTEVDLVSGYADILQAGARNMQHLIRSPNLQTKAPES